MNTTYRVATQQYESVLSSGVKLLLCSNPMSTKDGEPYGSGPGLYEPPRKPLLGTPVNR